MENQVTKEELRELESCLAPIENRMDKVVKDYFLASRSHAAVSPLGDLGANDVFDDTYDMQSVYELLNFFRKLIENHGGLPSFTSSDRPLRQPTRANQSNSSCTSSL